ncbi:MAG: hypothetical protein WKG00_03405 [Polyangiaceae bacterium]
MTAPHFGLELLSMPRRCVKCGDRIEAGGLAAMALAGARHLVRVPWCLSCALRHLREDVQG